MTFADLHLADATIQRLQSQAGVLEVHGQDWRERAFVLRFKGVAGFENLGVEGEEISHGDEVGQHDLILRVGADSDDERASLRCFRIFGAWAARELLAVVATEVDIEGPLQDRQLP